MTIFFFFSILNTGTFLTEFERGKSGVVTKKIKKRRKELRMSQSYLSEVSGVNRATLSQLESGKEIDIRISTLLAISKALKCSPSKLFD